MFALNWLTQVTGFRGNFFLNIFPIGSYVKTMSADSGHLGWRSGSQDIILKVEEEEEEEEEEDLYVKS